MINYSAVVVFFILFVFSYLIVLDIATANLFYRRHFAVLAITILFLFCIFAGAVFYVYYASNYDIVVLYMALIIVAIFSFLYYIKYIYKNWNKINKYALAVVVIFMVLYYYLTFMNRIGGDNGWTKETRWSPFLGVRQYFETGSTSLLYHFYANIALFIPFGVLIPLVNRRHRGKIGFAAMLGYCISSTTEVMQHLTHLGMFDVDDIIANVFGAIIGCIICKVVMYFYDEKKYNWKQTKV